MLYARSQATTFLASRPILMLEAEEPVKCFTLVSDDLVEARQVTHIKRMSPLLDGWAMIGVKRARMRHVGTHQQFRGDDSIDSEHTVSVASVAGHLRGTLPSRYAPSPGSIAFVA